MKNTNKSVKKHQTCWVLLLAMLVSGAMQAKVNSYIGATANVGEWSMIPSDSKYGPSFGVAGGVGFLYELQAGGTYSPTRFLLDIGVNAQGGMTSYMQGSSLVDSMPNQVDLDNYSFNYIYEVNDRHDQYTKIAAQVPLMIGFQHDKFYMLAGVKAGFNIYKKAATTAMVNTYGTYREFDDHKHMPEYQFFDDMPYKGVVDAAMQLDLDMSVELGGRLGLVTDAVGYDVPKRKTELRMGAYVDYGLLDLRSSKNATAKLMDMPSYNAKEAYNPDGTNQSMITNLKMNDIMSTNGFASAVKNLVVGVKFTVLFQLPEEGKCVICRDAYGTSVRSRSGGGVKYEE